MKIPNTWRLIGSIAPVMKEDFRTKFYWDKATEQIMVLENGQTPFPLEPAKTFKEAISLLVKVFSDSWGWLIGKAAFGELVRE
jgi:hypothetical protein